MNEIHIFKVAISCGAEGMEHQYKMIEIMMKLLLEADSSMKVSQIEWQGTLKAQKKELLLTKGEGNL